MPFHLLSGVFLCPILNKAFIIKLCLHCVRSLSENSHGQPLVFVSFIFPCSSGNVSSGLGVNSGQPEFLILEQAVKGRQNSVFVLSKMDKVDLTPFHLSYIIELILFVISFYSVLNPLVQSSGKCIIMFTALKYNYYIFYCMFYR